MGSDVVFANAQIIMRSQERLLTKKRIRAMATAPDRAGVLTILAECGYDVTAANDDDLVAAERAQTLRTFCELCADPAVTANVQAWANLTEANATATFTQMAATTPKIKNRTIRDYFTTLVDLINVRNAAKGSHVFFPGGQLTADALKIDPATLTQQLVTLANTDRDNIFQPNPLFWWYCQKQQELVAVSLILLSKRFHYDAAFLRANLRGLYEQF